jgi:hypothetical protein
MKTSIFSLFVVSLLVMNAPAATPASHSPKDNGAMCTTWIPKSLVPLLGKQFTGLIAKYEPSSGTSYYIVTVGLGKNTRVSLTTCFFKAENGKATLLGKDVHKFPFSEYIKNSETVRFLWEDYLGRWIKQDGRDGIQEKINARANAQITEEEAFYLSHAGFKIPPTMKQVPNFLSDKSRPDSKRRSSR